MNFDYAYEPARKWSEKESVTMKAVVESSLILPARKNRSEYFWMTEADKRMVAQMILWLNEPNRFTVSKERLH